MHKKNYLFFLVLMGVLGFSGKALAVCPVCTIAVGAGVGLSRYFGIDDTIAGLWIGGLTISLIVWTINWFEKKKINFWGRNPLTFLGYLLLVILPLRFSQTIWHPYNTLWGMNKLLLGIVLGGLFFSLGVWCYADIKKKRGKAYFPFEKVVMPVTPLIIFSIIFYFLTK